MSPNGQFFFEIVRIFLNTGHDIGKISKCCQIFGGIVRGYRILLVAPRFPKLLKIWIFYDYFFLAFFVGIRLQPSQEGCMKKLGWLCKIWVNFRSDFHSKILFFENWSCRLDSADNLGSIRPSKMGSKIFFYRLRWELACDFG